MTVGSNKLECRKVRKPKIEKLRRARINSSLESLKEILLRNTISIPQGARPTKLEKADILEMTVRYVEMLHEKLAMSPTEKSMETLRWSSCHERGAFVDITNQMDKRRQKTQIADDNKAWLSRHLNLHRQSSPSRFDKENSRHEHQSMLLGEPHWRPW